VAERLTKKTLLACLVPAAAAFIACLIEHGQDAQAEDFRDWLLDELEVDLSYLLPDE